MVTPQVAIDSLANGGDGVGRVEGRVLFVPLTAPGDIVSVRVLSQRKAWGRGSVEEIIHPSPLRTDPPCPLFGTCGGCQWQHVQYDAQLDAKAGLVIDALRRIGGIDGFEEVKVRPSPRTYGYRHRCRLQVRATGRTVETGFFRFRSHDLVPVAHCPVLTDTLNSLIPVVTSAARHLSSANRPLDSITLASDFSGGAARVEFRGEGEVLDLPAAAAGDICRTAADGGIELAVAGFRERGLALGPDRNDIIAPGSAFTQVNLAQNRHLVSGVLSLAEPARGPAVLDLFCGTGNFSIPLAAAGAGVLGIDISGAAVASARENTRRLGLEARFRRGDAVAGAISLTASGDRFDLVVVNPPRTGGRELMNELPALGAANIIIVSCDPATFARDASLLSAGGYRLERLEAFDLFPQTFHVETVGLFRRREPTGSASR